MLSNKTLNPFVNENLIGCRKLNMTLVFITKSYFIAKFYTIFYYANSKQTRASTNRN